MEPKIIKLTTNEYWQSNFGEMNLLKFQENIYSKVLKKHLKENQNAECIEIGGYPGHLLGWMSKEFKYIPTALDYLSGIESMQELFKYNGINNLKLINEDFLSFRTSTKYDIVSSFGFVEHFDNYTEIINKHIEILKPGGKLVIGVPYLGGLQLLMRRFFYKKEKLDEVLKIHNRKIMNLKELKKVIGKSGNMKFDFANYIGEMDIWFTEDSIRKSRRLLFKLVKQLSLLVKKLGVSNKFISPLILAVATKQNL